MDAGANVQQLFSVAPRQRRTMATAATRHQAGLRQNMAVYQTDFSQSIWVQDGRVQGLPNGQGSWHENYRKTKGFRYPVQPSMEGYQRNDQAKTN